MKIGLLMLVFAVFAMLFALEPVSTTTRGMSRDQIKLNATLPQMTNTFTVGAVGLDTVTTAISIPGIVSLQRIEIMVTDTVESRGDSALVKVLIGSTEIFSQMTSAFKLGISTAPRVFTFTPTALFSPLAGGALSYRITQSATSGTEGIVDGSFKFKLFYAHW